MLTRAVPHLHNHYNNIEMSFSIVYTGEKIMPVMPLVNGRASSHKHSDERMWFTYSFSVLQCFWTYKMGMLKGGKILPSCFRQHRLELFKQHLELTPWWRSEEAFDFFNMKAWDKFNQQAVVQPSPWSPVTDLCKIVLICDPSTCRPLIHPIACSLHPRMPG